MKWFGFRPKNQSYRPKVGATDQKSELQQRRPSESEPNRPEKEPEWRLDASADSPLKAFLNPPNSKSQHLIHNWTFCDCSWEIQVAHVGSKQRKTAKARKIGGGGFKSPMGTTVLALNWAYTSYRGAKISDFFASRPNCPSEWPEGFSQLQAYPIAPPLWCKVTFVSFLDHFQVEPESHFWVTFWVTLIVLEFGLCSCRPHSQAHDGLKLAEVGRDGGLPFKITVLRISHTFGWVADRMVNDRSTYFWPIRKDPP